MCIITQNVGFGGMEVHTLALMSALVDRGYIIELVVNRYDRYDEIVRERGWQERVRMIHTDLDGILYGERSDARGWRNVLAGISSPVLLFPKGDHNYGQVGFLRECRRAFTKIVFIEHLEARGRPDGSGARRFGFIPPLGLWWHKKRWLSRAGSRYADKIVTVSDKVRERLVTDIGYRPDKLVVVRNGVPWKEFVRDEARGEAVRREHGIAADAFVFGMLTRLTPAKGIDTALRAIHRLAQECPDRSFVLVVAGEGYEGDRLKELASSLHIEDRVRFVGFVSRPDEILSAYDVILFSSRVEGLPLGLLQGMAAGCIPIVTRISGMPEAVDSPRVGWVVPPESAEGVAAAMKAAIDLDSKARSAMRQNVIGRVKESFDVDQANRRIIEICES